MIKLSKLSDYAIVVLSHLASDKGAVMTTGVLATASCIPEPTVSKVLKLLSRQKIVVSVRGASGGYRIDRDPRQITVTELITALEGPIALTSCVDEHHSDCMIEHVCPLKTGWHKVNHALTEALNKVSLADLLVPVRGRKHG